MARVCSVIRSATDAGSSPYVWLSTSANTGIAFCATIVAAVADIVYGDTITSSPGSISAAASATCSPVVAEFTAIA